ncbi:MAG: dethiobiotin synthase [Archangium sp.]|nr:dethiobiotin synthase [Archangium sp.]
MKGRPSTPLAGSTETGPGAAQARRKTPLDFARGERWSSSAGSINPNGRPRSRRAPPLRFFVTGTDTGVGKTEVSAALLEAMVAQGLRPFAFKPCESGGNADSQTLWEAAGSWQKRQAVCLYRFRAPLAPALAARAERKKVQWRRLLSGFRALGDGPGVVEGAGGLFVPLDERHDVIDLIEATGLPVVLVARAGLGTINHTVLSLDALLARGLGVAAVVLVQARRGWEPSLPTNRPELERRFPHLPFLGPLPFSPHAKPRRALMAKALAPLIASEL